MFKHRSARMLTALVGLTLAGSALSFGGAHAASASPAHPVMGMGGRPARAAVAAPHAQVAISPHSLPASVDLSGYAPTPGNQGQVGSCVTWAIDYGMLGWYANRDGRTTGPGAPMYTYSQIHYDNSDGGGGSYPTVALQHAIDEGSDTRTHYQPQGDFNWHDLPTAAERANAVNYKIKSYSTIFPVQNQVNSDADLLKQALANGQPVAIGFHVRKSFQNFWYKTETTSLYRDTLDSYVGWHEMLALGYDANGLLVQNSWSTDWGNQGRVRLSWDVVARDVDEGETMSGFSATPVNPTKPVVGAVSRSIAAGYSVGNTVPVQLKWSATATGGVAQYSIWSQTNGGTWVDSSSKLSSNTATSIVFGLTRGSSYRFAVAAKNSSGTWSDYSYTSTFKTNAYDDTRVSYSSGWRRNAWASAFGGYEVTSATAGATAKFTYTGKGVAWVAPKAANRGKAYVYFDGAYVATVDLYKATTSARVAVLSRTYSSSGTHTVVIKVVGTSGRPAVDIDAFAVMG